MVTQLAFAPKILQEWIMELRERNERLTTDNIKLHKAMGSTYFKPVQI